MKQVIWIILTLLNILYAYPVYLDVRRKDETAAFQHRESTPATGPSVVCRLASCGFPSPAADYVESDRISMIAAYGTQARLTISVPAVTACPTAAFTMAICWLWTVQRSPGTAILLWPVCGEFTVKRLLLTPRLTLQPMSAAAADLSRPGRSGYLWRRHAHHPPPEGDVLMFARPM